MYDLALVTGMVALIIFLIALGVCKEKGILGTLGVIILTVVVFLLVIVYGKGKGEYTFGNWINPIQRGEIYKSIATAEHNSGYLVIMMRYKRDPEFYWVYWRPPEVGKCFTVVYGEKAYAQEVECKKVLE